MMKTLVKNETFEIAADEQSGGIASFKLYGEEMLAPGPAPLADLALNGEPLELQVTPHTWNNIGGYPNAGDPVNEMHASRFLSHYTGYSLDVTRSLREVRPDQVCLTYTVQRTKIRTLPECPGPGWGAIEAPLHVETLTMPCLPWKGFGANTHMIAFNTGSAGPRNHLGYENGPVAHVKAVVNTWFRRQYSAVMGFPGALFYDPKSGRWLAISCRRPNIAYNLNHEAAAQGVAFDFLTMGELKMSQTVQLPLVMFQAGRTREEMDRFLATFMSQYYEEPADWFTRTTWFEMACGAETFVSWKHMHQAALRLTEKGGVSGLFVTLHARNLAFGGTSPNSSGPCEELGPRADFEAMIRDLKARGTRLMIWMSSCGLNPQGDADPDWFVRGVDGDWLTSWGLPHQPHIVFINHLHPGYQAYVKRWMEYYLGELGMDSVFFDCSGFAYPCDFAPRSFMRYPSDLMLGNVRFFDFVRETARRIRPDAVVMTEGHGFDAFSNVTSLNNMPAEADGLGQRDRVLAFRHQGGKRFCVRSGMEADFGSGYVMIEPGANYHIAPDNSGLDLAEYARIGADPFNILLTRLMKEHGCRDAVNLPCGGGVSRMGDLLFVPQPRHYTMSPAALVPVARGAVKTDGIRVAIPESGKAPRLLRNLHGGKDVKAEADGTFVCFERGIYRVE
jgi:hypothetical protein